MHHGKLYLAVCWWIYPSRTDPRTASSVELMMNVFVYLINYCSIIDLLRCLNVGYLFYIFVVVDSIQLAIISH